MGKNLTPKANGRPRLFETPEQFDAKVEEYQTFCEVKEYPVTWTGLALYLGFSSRQSIDEYLNYDGFSDSVKRAKAFVEWHYEMKLHGSSPTGSIFALKNFGWSDKSAEPEGISADQVIEIIRAARPVQSEDSSH
jgi:hypothetical protein